MTTPGTQVQSRACIAALCCSLLLAGCTSLSVSPSGGTYASPVTVSVGSSSRLEPGSLTIIVDGVDRTSDFSTTAGQPWSAQLTLAPGTHTVQASANVWNNYDRRYDSRSAQATFEAGPPGGLALSISTSSAAVVPGGSVDVGLTIARSGSFGGNVDVFAPYPGYPTTDTTTVNVFNSTGVLTLRARADASAAELDRTITARGALFSGTVQDAQPFTFRIGHRTGPFARATFAARVAGEGATALDGQTTLEVENGPPGAPRYEARFRRPTFTPGAVIGFEPGIPSTGGGGFCTTGPVGFVISGGNSTTAHVLTLVFFEDAFSRLSLPIPASASNGPVVVPEVYFSPDCAVVIMVGADTQSQRALRAEVYDVHRQRTLCSVPFDVAGTLQAQFTSPVADNQELRITVGAQTIGCPVF